MDIAKIIDRRERDKKAADILCVTPVTNKYNISEQFNKLFKEYFSYWGYYRFTSQKESFLHVMELNNSMGVKPIKENNIQHIGKEKPIEIKEVDDIRIAENDKAMKKLYDGMNKASFMYELDKVGVTLRNEVETGGVKTVDTKTWLVDWAKKNGYFPHESVSMWIQVVKEKKDSSKFNVMATLTVSLRQSFEMMESHVHVVAFGVGEVNKLLNKPPYEFITEDLEKYIDELSKTTEYYCKRYEINENLYIYTNSFYGTEEVQF